MAKRGVAAVAQRRRPNSPLRPPRTPLVSSVPVVGDAFLTTAPTPRTMEAIHQYETYLIQQRTDALSAQSRTRNVNVLLAQRIRALETDILLQAESERAAQAALTRLKDSSEKEVQELSSKLSIANDRIRLLPYIQTQATHILIEIQRLTFDMYHSVREIVKTLFHEQTDSLTNAIAEIENVMIEKNRSIHNMLLKGGPLCTIDEIRQCLRRFRGVVFPELFQVTRTLKRAAPDTDSTAVSFSVSGELWRQQPSSSSPTFLTEGPEIVGAASIQGKKFQSVSVNTEEPDVITNDSLKFIDTRTAETQNKDENTSGKKSNEVSVKHVERMDAFQPHTNNKSSRCITPNAAHRIKAEVLNASIISDDPSRRTYTPTDFSNADHILQIREELRQTRQRLQHITQNYVTLTIRCKKAESLAVASRECKRCRLFSKSVDTNRTLREQLKAAQTHIHTKFDRRVQALPMDLKDSELTHTQLHQSERSGNVRTLEEGVHETNHSRKSGSLARTVSRKTTSSLPSHQVNTSQPAANTNRNRTKTSTTCPVHLSTDQPPAETHFHKRQHQAEANILLYKDEALHLRDQIRTLEEKYSHSERRVKQLLLQLQRIERGTRYHEDRPSTSLLISESKAENVDTYVRTLDDHWLEIKQELNACPDNLPDLSEDQDQDVVRNIRHLTCSDC